MEDGENRALRYDISFKRKIRKKKATMSKKLGVGRSSKGNKQELKGKKLKRQCSTLQTLFCGYFAAAYSCVSCALIKMVFTEIPRLYIDYHSFLADISKAPYFIMKLILRLGCDVSLYKRHHINISGSDEMSRCRTAVD